MMTSWHAQLLDPSPVGGVWRSVSRLTAGLVDAGHAAVLLEQRGDNPPQEQASQSERGVVVAPLTIRAFMVSTRDLDRLAERFPPDIMHLHWGFVPHHATLASWARRRSIPVAYQARGALASAALARRGRRKRAYLHVVERRLIEGADLHVGTTQGDLDDLRRLVPAITGHTALVPNAVTSAPEIARLPPRPDVDRCLDSPVCGYLGRWDVLNKGLDRLFSVARQTPDVGFRLHTDLRPTRDARLAQDLLANIPSNAAIVDPVDGLTKQMALSSMALYVQLSRWESFGNSVAEAMVVGTPVVVAREMHISSLVREHGLGLVVDADDPASTAEEIMRLLRDRDRWLEMSRKARLYGRGAFTNEQTAVSMLDAYGKVVA